MQYIIPIVVLIILIYINAFFASAEIALISLNKNKLQKMLDDGDKNAKKLIKLTENSSDFLSTIQIAITLAGFTNSAIAADTFANPITNNLIKYLPFINEGVLNTIIIVLITLILSYFSLVFGELVPKRIAMQKPYEIAARSSSIIIFVSYITKPLVRLLSHSQNLVLKLLKYNIDKVDEEVTEEDIQIMLSIGGQYGTIKKDEKEWIENVFNFNDISVEEAMTRKSDIVAIEIKSSNDDILTTIKNSGLSRFPIYDGDLNNIVGILNTREFLINLSSKHPKEIIKIIRSAYFVPESIRADVLFRDLQKKKLPIAVVIDEYGETSGIITMEDLIEEIVGNIYDEYDLQEEPEIIKLGDNLWRINGTTYIDDIADELGIEIQKDESYDTIGGMVLSCLHTIPKDGSHLVVEINNLHIDVKRIQNRKIEEVELSIIKNDEPENENDDDEVREKKKVVKVLKEIDPTGKAVTENLHIEE